MSTHHLVNDSITNHDLLSDSTLHVVAVISNPVRFHSRYRLFREWADQIESTPNAKLYVVEIAHGDRHFEVTETGHERHLQLRNSHELWQKEAMINAGVRHLLPHDWKYLAWIDADVWFHDKKWALETIHELQSYHVVQPWSECIDLGPNGNVLQVHSSFASIVAAGQKLQSTPTEPYKFGHPGYAWACTREFYENVGGVMDFPILGAADSHMAWAMVNRVEASIHHRASAVYKQQARDWQTKAFRVTNGHLGCVPGHLVHKWHGSKKNRFYQDRWKVLVENKFDPVLDIRRDHQGLWQFTPGKPNLTEACRRYFRSRNEDSIDEV